MGERKGYRKSKSTYDPKISKNIRKCPCGIRLKKLQKTYCSMACRTNRFWGIKIASYIEYTFPGCNHTRIVLETYLKKELRGKYCSRECYPGVNFDNVECYKYYNIYSGQHNKINYLDGIATDIETRELVRYKRLEDGTCKRVEE